MTLAYFDDINVYFHMKNHYKMLKHVKSVVDTSIPQSLLKSPIAMNNLDKRMKAATNEHLRQIYITDQNRTTKRRGPVKKHNCLKITKSEASLKAENSSRSKTRINSSATHPNAPLFLKSYSMGPSKFVNMFKFKQKRRPSAHSTRTTNSDIQNLDLQHNENGSPLNGSNEAKSTARSEPLFASENKSPIPKSSEEHEYLLFLLRITEDIISNDFYSNRDIERIFQAHIDLNKDRLNMRKMYLHITNLCKELNIDCKKFQEKLQTTDELDPPEKFQFSPDSRTYALNNDAFKSCKACSVIRGSSLYKMHSELEGCCALADSLGGESFMENIGDSASISPHLLKLLGKLSLGRVTECTEPLASTSTINSPGSYFPNDVDPEEINNFKKSDLDPIDFETFVKELNSKENVLNVAPEEHKDLISSENGLVVTDRSIIKENPPDNSESFKNGSSNVNIDISFKDLELPNDTSENSKSFVELTEKETDGNSFSKKSDFEKGGSKNGLLIFEELTIKNIQIEENISQSKIPLSNNELEKISDIKEKLVKTSSKIPIPVKDNKPEKNPQIVKNEKIEDVSAAQSNKSSIASKVSTSLSSKYSSNTQEIKETEVQSSLERHTTENNEINQLSPKLLQNVGDSPREVDESSHNNFLKVILQGAVKDDDYIMVKGPLYVYKPLLESEPKLIIFAENNQDQKSRRNSMESLHSHKTFTVDHSHVLDQHSADQAIQYDASIRSGGPNNCMDNILELTKTAYTQFIDNYKLLQSDYDLTPERDGSDNKYHHLLIDAATSISGVNITENLLLTDDYLVKNDIDLRQFTNKNAVNDTTWETDKNIDSDLNNYIKLEPKMYETNYVINRKLISSASMPRLHSYNDRSCTGRNNDLKAKNVFKKCSSNLIDFDEPSQDSSLRSEGEALHNFDSSRNGIAWTLYYPRK